MRLTIFTAVLLITLSAPSQAQDAPDVEVFGGYSFFKGDGGGSLHGWNASIVGNLGQSFGVVADLSGHYGTQSLRADFSDPDFPATIIARADSNAKLHMILGGLQYAYRKHKKITPFAHALFGASRLSTKATLSFAGITREISTADIAFTAAFGGGLDLKLNENVSLRMIQADYVLTRFGGSTQSNARLSIGIVLH
ncbi:MAG: outer membrane beta-barrel protein [Blastocatellia bacterium]